MAVLVLAASLTSLLLVAVVPGADFVYTPVAALALTVTAAAVWRLTRPRLYALIVLFTTACAAVAWMVDYRAGGDPAGPVIAVALTGAALIAAVRLWWVDEQQETGVLVRTLDAFSDWVRQRASTVMSELAALREEMEVARAEAAQADKDKKIAEARAEQMQATMEAMSHGPRWRPAELIRQQPSMSKISQGSWSTIMLVQLRSPEMKAGTKRGELVDPDGHYAAKAVRLTPSPGSKVNDRGAGSLAVELKVYEKLNRLRLSDNVPTDDLFLPVVDFGIDSFDGQDQELMYFVTPYSDQGTLNDWMNPSGGHMLTVKLAWDALVHQAECYQILHERCGEMLLDAKPANVLRAGDRWKVIDFGACIPTDPLVRLDHAIHLRFARFLNIAYAAPEQLEGDQYDTSADLYALGSIGYVMFTGLLPCGVPPDAPDRTVLDLKKNGYEPFDPREYMPDLPQAAAEVLQALTALDPDDRPSTTDAVLLLDAARPTTLAERPLRPWETPEPRRAVARQSGAETVVLPDRRIPTVPVGRQPR